MELKFGPYKIKARELDNKLSLQITSDRGEVSIERSNDFKDLFPNTIVYQIENPGKEIKAKSLKKISFGLYKFILGINYQGELTFSHSPKLTVSQKKIDNKDVLTLSLFKEPK